MSSVSLGHSLTLNTIKTKCMFVTKTGVANKRVESFVDCCFGTKIRIEKFRASFANIKNLLRSDPVP